MGQPAIPCYAQLLEFRLNLLEEIAGDLRVAERTDADRDRAVRIVLPPNRDLDLRAECSPPDDLPVQARGILGGDGNVLRLENGLGGFHDLLRSPRQRPVEVAERVGRPRRAGPRGV